MRIDGGQRVVRLAVLALALACAPDSDVDGVVGAAGVSGRANAGSGGAGGSDEVAPDGGAPDGGRDNGGQGGSDSQRGLGGTDSADAGSLPPVPQGGAGGSMIIGTGGTDQGQGGSDVGAGGTDVGQAGTGGTSAGTGGTDQGQAGTEQGGTGGTGGDPSPLCDHESRSCDGLLYKECDLDAFPIESLCDYNCDTDRGGCYGECANDDVRCADGAAQACVDGVWTTTEQCAFQCVNAACEGACTPGTVVCDGLSTVTCGSDFQWSAPAACPTDPYGTTSCNDDECDLQPIACSAGTADCDGNWSCEADLTSTATCGSCDTACPTRANAIVSCTESACTFVCISGFEDCDGDPSNGCELDTPGFADCDGDPSNGCELDTRADALNCGACGNSCYGSTCTARECQFGFDVVSDFTSESSSSNVREMALSATHVYWLTDNELRRAPKAGGTYETMTTISGASGGGDTRGLVVELGYVCWGSVDGVYVMPESGGTPTRIYQGLVRGIAAADGKLYWNNADPYNSCLLPNYNNQSAFRSCSNGRVTTFYGYDLETDTFDTSWQRSGEHSAPLAVIGTELFVAEYQPIFVQSHADYSIRIMARNATTGATLRIVADAVSMLPDGLTYGIRTQLFSAAFEGDTLVYSSPFANGTASPSALVTGPIAGGAPPQSTNTVLLQTGTGSLDLDGTSVFYVGSSGVNSISLEGGTPHPFFDNDTGRRLILAVDDTHIYFSAYATNGEQAVLRAPK